MIQRAWMQHCVHLSGQERGSHEPEIGMNPAAAAFGGEPKGRYSVGTVALLTKRGVVVVARNCDRTDSDDSGPGRDAASPVSRQKRAGGQVDGAFTAAGPE